MQICIILVFGESQMFCQIHQIFPHQTFPLYGMPRCIYICMLCFILLSVLAMHNLYTSSLWIVVMQYSMHTNFTKISDQDIKDWLLSSRNKVDDPLFILRHQYNFTFGSFYSKSTKHWKLSWQHFQLYSVLCRWTERRMWSIQRGLE